MSKRRSRLLMLAAASAIVATGAGCANEAQPPAATPPSGESPAPTPARTPTPTPPPTSQAPGASTHAYKDGTYTAEGSYFTHAGPESVTITLTLKNDLITDSKFNGAPNAEMSGFYMQMFADTYKPLVIGKNIADVQLDRVSGSSLTPMGFNDAVAKIKAQAAISG